VHALHPAAIFCWALSRENVTSWSALRQSMWHVDDVWPSSTSKPHE
jgi:hypothetical protein